MRCMNKWMAAALAAALAGTFAAGGRAQARDRARDRREDARDWREDLRDRREDVRDRREGLRERLRDVKDPEARKELAGELKAKAGQGRENAVAKRQENQAKRIEHGIKKGCLTEEEAAKLKSQQEAIAALEASFAGDGFLSAKEFRTLGVELRTASRNIWAQKHDADGGQMPVYRLGRNVFAKDEFTARLAGGRLSKGEARALAADFRRMLRLERELACEDLDAGQRAGLQAEFNELLNKYFELREGQEQGQ